MAGYLVTALCPYCPPEHPSPDCIECGGRGEVEVEVATRELAPPKCVGLDSDASLED